MVQCDENSSAVLASVGDEDGSAHVARSPEGVEPASGGGSQGSGNQLAQDAAEPALKQARRTREDGPGGSPP